MGLTPIIKPKNYKTTKHLSNGVLINLFVMLSCTVDFIEAVSLTVFLRNRTLK